MKYKIFLSKKMSGEEQKISLKWDGTCLGEMSAKDVDIDYQDGKLGTIVIKGEKIICYIHLAKNSLPAVIDELKPIFQLTKSGTHYLIVNKKVYILIKPVKDGIDVDLKTFLEKESKEMTPFLFHQVQKIFLFRSILGLPTFERHIVIRREKGKLPRALSVYDGGCVIEKEKEMLSEKARKKWFSTMTVGECLKKVLDFQEKEDDSYSISFCQNLNDMIDKRISAVDKGYVWMTNYIVEKISNLLS